MRFLLDSTVLIDHVSGIDAAEAFLRDYTVDSGVSVITVNELLGGLNRKMPQATNSCSISSAVSRWTT